MKRRKFLFVTGTTTAATILPGFRMVNLKENNSPDLEPIATGTERIENLTKRISGLPPREMSLDYARIITRSFQNTEDLPVILRRAKAFQDITEQLPIDIDHGELIVGNITSKPRVPYFAPEIWNWSQHTPGEPVHIHRKFHYSEDIEFRFNIPAEVEAYWHDKPSGGTVGHFIADYEKVLKYGFSGISREIDQHISDLKKNGNLSKDTLDFYQAAKITCKAAIRFAKRHAELARQQANLEQDPLRKAELFRIAEICQRCPAEPAQSFYEALQSFWFTHALLHINSNEWSISPGRFDQYIHPYYQKDISNNLINRDQAEELMACLWIKFNEVRVNMDVVNYQNLMIGGTDEKGNDVSNEVSWLCIQTTHRIKGVQPSLSMRWHPGTPGELLAAASGLILAGTGRPAMFNDLVCIPALEATGVSPRDSWNYAIVGCEELATPGNFFGAARGGALNNPICLLKALDNDENSFPDFDAVLNAYRNEMKDYLSKQLDWSHEAHRKIAEHTPSPYASLLFDDCIKQGLDLTGGGARYNVMSLSEQGVVTAADSLYVIKQAVFEDRVFTLRELKQALANDFKGYENIQAYCRNRVPKFGNDLEEVDHFVRIIVDMNDSAIKELNRNNYMGGPYVLGSGQAWAWMAGLNTGATPDGRNDRQSFSVSIGPSNGADQEGPTAMLNSVAKIKWVNQPGGALTHVRLPYSGVAGPFLTSNVSALISTFFQKGGMGVHFSVVNADILKAAMEDPLNHLDIIVRVGGFSAPFALLDTYMQQEIIERTEHQY